MADNPVTPEEYLSRMSKVEGWLHRESAEALVEIAAVAAESGVPGGSAEIGVHHGRLFILLSLLASPSVAIDVFDQQDLNVDHSGRGDREVFVGNCQRFGLDPERISILESSSEKIEPDEIVAGNGKVRLFSVDGGHTADLTENDLRLAEQCVAPGGVVILDDYFNPEWPDVSVGANRALATSNLEPFAIAPNKVFLTNQPDAAARYRSVLEARSAYLGTKIMAGSPVVVLAGDWRHRVIARLRRTGVVRVVGSSRWGRPLGRLARNVLSK